MSDTANVDNDGFYRVDFAAAETEIQEGEYVRMDYEFGGIGVPIFVRDPLERMQDGYFFGLQHRVNDGTVDQTTFKIRRRVLQARRLGLAEPEHDSSLTVPAEDEATFELP